MSITVNENLIAKLEAQVTQQAATIEELKQTCAARADQYTEYVDMSITLKATIAQQAATIQKLREALQWMSDKRAFTIFIEEEAHVANFFEKCDAALASVTEGATP
jgi:uncharacterized coiled-coil protein SlyX